MDPAPHPTNRAPDLPASPPSDRSGNAETPSRWPWRWRPSIAVVLTLTFGILTTLAVGSVLLLGVIGASKNTQSLLRDKVQLTINAMVERMRSHLEPVHTMVERAAEMIVAGEVDSNDLQQMTDYMMGALAPLPQLVGVGWLTPDGVVWRFSRPDHRVYLENWSDRPVARLLLRDAGTDSIPIWAAPTYSPTVGGTVLTLRVPVRKAGKLLGILVAVVPIADLSRHVERLSEDLGFTTFILYDRNYVLAHPSFTTAPPRQSADHPLPELNEITDRVLPQIWHERRRTTRLIGALTDGSVHIIERPEDYYVFVLRDLDDYGDRTLTIGTYLPGAEAGAEVERLMRMGAVGAGVLALSLVLTILLGRRLGRPMLRLAGAAQLLSSYDFQAVPSLARSRVRELDAAATAFNAMVAGMRWFETYIPRRLVHRLIDGGADASGQISKDRQMTVMFTDIAGFSSLAEQLPAPEVAAYLNHHFTLAGACIEATEGTIDKYIGDSVMAFWGAPIRQPDHAMRACRTALAIRRAIEDDNAARRAAGLQVLGLRIGVHTGRVIVGNIGAPTRVNYTLVGDTVNIAQRLEEAGREFANGPEDIVILISDATAAAIGPAFETEELGTQRLRGRAGEVGLLRLIGERAAATGSSAATEIIGASATGLV
jgi:class 3 adenylate cyclase